ncbi:hypothetical protein Salat_1653400, partial [Sesamum alatum]
MFITGLPASTPLPNCIKKSNPKQRRRKVFYSCLSASQIRRFPNRATFRTAAGIQWAGKKNNLAKLKHLSSQRKKKAKAILGHLSSPVSNRRRPPWHSLDQVSNLVTITFWVT